MVVRYSTTKLCASVKTSPGAGFTNDSGNRSRGDRPELPGSGSDKEMMSERAQALAPCHEPLSERLF